MPSHSSVDKPRIVHLILDQKAEEALETLAEHYKVDVPKLKVGLPKGHKNVCGCYTSKNQTISVASSDFLGNPFVILHEFYHHLRSRSVDKQHKGTEKNADKFATEFLREYQATGGHVTC
jgi:Zn-dependent peptidase ImmA (M78 family)